MAAPAFRARTMLAGATATSRTYAVPATSKAGDTLIIWCYVEALVTLSLSGWTKLAETQQVSEGWTAGCFVLANWNGSTTTYVLSWGGASKRNSGAIESISGADTGSPVNAQSGAGMRENASSKNAVVDGLTTTVEECLLLSGVYNNNGATASPGSGWTEDGDQADSPQICHKTAAASKGVQSSVTHTLGHSSINLTLMLALQPPPVTGKRRRFVSVG
ncbi:MAG TPA: hypothetical protein VFI03_13255 [Solirubrobacterales bacterium]|nr:hypothetical protein [Solirubrobacterales bacterium]